MKQAVELERAFGGLTIEEDGFCCDREWKLAVQTARRAAIANEHELPWQSGSSDADEFLTFMDGSRLMIANPRQASFAGFVRALD